MRLWLAAAISLAVFAATPSAQAEGKTHVIEIRKMAFAQAPEGISVGDRIVWRNADVVSHTATASSGEFDLTIPVGEEVQTVVNTPGDIQYFCRFHIAMKSVLAVQP